MIDLHIHTNCSDGELSAVNVLEKAEKQGTKYLSITDHDSVMAYKELEGVQISQYYKGKLIPGVELTFLHNDTIMEVLGYGIDINKISEFYYVQKVLNTDIFKQQAERLARLKNVCDSLGIRYSKDLKIDGPNSESNDVLLDDIILCKENKEILDGMGIVDRTTFYRQHFCNSNSPFYIDTKQDLPTIQEVSKAIRDANGKCFLAHIFKYGLASPVETMQEFIDLNLLDGLECYHKEHSIEQAEYLEDVCRKNNLLMSGGSDLHRGKDLLGYCNRYRDKIPDRIIENWKFCKISKEVTRNIFDR